MKILVLAGGFDQIALITELKSRGHEVYLADYLESPPAKDYADRFFRVSTLDEEAIYQIVIDEKIELVTTACTDQALMTVALVSEKAGLSCYISTDTARNVTDKAYMKLRFLQFDIPTAECVILEDEWNYREALSEGVNFPVVVKPCDCNSSKGVEKVNDYVTLEKAIDRAFELSRSKKVIVEEYIEGREISIDVWKDREGAKILSVTQTEKIHTNADNFTIYQSKYPVDISDILMNEIQLVAEKICIAFDLNNCPILIQAIVSGDEIKIVEFSARMGGGSKYKLIERISGIDIMRVYADRILGDYDQRLNPVLTSKRIELDYVYCYNGKVEELIGFEDLARDGAIKDLFLYKSLGSVIEKMTTSSDRILGFLIQADREEELLECRRHIIKSTDILDDKGASIMYKKCFACDGDGYSDK